MGNFAPIVLFAYCRPEHLRNTLKTLMQCEGFEESPVIVYCDGPRHADKAEAVRQTQEVAKTMLGEKAEYHFSNTNFGLSRAIIAGVSHVIERFGRAIVIEDDLALSPLFLRFMNDALDRYAHHENIFQISGHMFAVPHLETTSTALFLPFTTSWGWGTWRRAWNQFDAEATGWQALLTDKKLRHTFNLDSSYNYSTMLLRQMSGSQDSWAIRWYWTVFQNKGLTLFPPTSLVRNTGFDGSGTHGKGLLRNFSNHKDGWTTTNIELPTPIEVNDFLYAEVKKALRQHNGKLLGKLVDWLRWQRYAYAYTRSKRHV